MSLSAHVALVPHDGVKIPISRLTKVAAALSKQVARDFGPIWSVDATVDPFESLDDVPIDYWPLIVVDKVEGAAGFHEDKSGQPYALIEMDDDWSLTASHECLEMLADPFGRRVRSGNLLDQAVKLGLEPARVRYLLEVCDPSESATAAYHINGVLVSDFFTPSFYDPVATAGTRYSFTSAITAPRTVLPDGYITWQDMKTRHWMQLCMFADDTSKKVPHVVDLNNNKVFQRLLGTTSIRSAVDAVTKTPDIKAMPKQQRMAAQQRTDSTDEAQTQRADELREAIEMLLRGDSAATPKRKGRSRS